MIKMGCCNKPKLLVFELSGEIKPYFADSKYKQKIFRNNQNKQKERLNEISEIQLKNKQLIEEYENLHGKVRRIMEWFSPRITIQNFEEHNRWTDSWTSIEYPLVPESKDQDTE